MNTITASLLFVTGVAAVGSAQAPDWQKYGSFSSPPPGRYVHGLVYDSHRQKVVLFGGFGLPTYLNDTWEFDQNGWTPVTSGTPPPAPRYAKMLAYDSYRQRVLLFGGANSTGFLDDTWEYDGRNWIQRLPAHHPQKRGDAAFAYDELRRRVVLFGGWDGTRRSDTWEWDGVDWQQINVTGPSGRSDVDMTYDAAHRRCLLYGGYASSAFHDTWEYDGSTWTLRSPSVDPGPLADVALAFDRGRNTVVLFGGAATQTGIRSMDTWEWDGSSWSKSTSLFQNSPPARWVSKMAYDEARGRMVLFSGHDNFNQFPADTWELVTPGVATYRTYGQGCAGTAGTPKLSLDGNALPRLGGTLALVLHALPLAPSTTAFFSIGTSANLWGSRALPLDLGFVGMPTCKVLASIDLAVGIGSVGGAARLATGVPNNPALLGQSLYFQGSVIDPGANAGNLVWSDAGQAKIGH